MQYFAEKHGKFIPTDPAKRQECFNWVYWQMGGFGPFCGQFGHFMVYAPADKLQARDYGVSRYGELVIMVAHNSPRSMIIYLFLQR